VHSQGLDLLPDAVVVVDADGVVLDANDRARDLLRIGRDDQGKRLGDLLDIQDLSGSPCALPPPAPRVGDRLAERTLTVERDGRSRPMLVTGRFRDGSWALVLRPAGGRLAAERRQSDVVATVSHEIRSPLASVKGFTRTLLTRWDRLSDDQKHAMLETIDADADRVTRLLLDLLEVARIDADRVQLRRAPVDLGTLVGRAVDRAARSEEADGRDLVLEIPEAPLEVSVDGDRIEQVLTNLLDNAIQHGHRGTVTVRLRSLPDGEVELEVEDEGPGVPLELRRVVFEKFGRGRTTRRAGTGLGLYITRGLVTAHGGTVELAESDVGARFLVRLPTGR
jgi:signal transduction histidine kinase